MAGTVTLEHSTLGNVRRITFTATADAADATFPATVLPAFQGRLIALHTNPGATAPQDNYDITLPDQDSIDRLQSVGLNRHTTNSQQVPVVYSSTSLNPPVHQGDVLTLTIAGNNVNSAIVVGSLYYSTGY
jgi:hypothetical protein